jgi:hypothetical protein
MYKPYKPRSRRWKQKPRRRPWYFYAAALAGILIGLELIARLVISSTGLSQTVLPQASELDKRVSAYQLAFLSPSGQPYALPDPGQLQAVRSPLLGYQLLPQQRSDYWAINAQGFRADKAVTPQKAANELRIFLMGGSMAFGQLSSSNQATLANQIETRLNAQVAAQKAQPGQFQPATLPYTADEVQKVLQRQARIPERQYRVVNAAVPGYASGNNLASLIQLSTYSPDLLLLLDGQSDLLLPSTYSAADVPGLDALLLNQAKPAPKFGEQWGSRITGWLNQLYAVQALQYLRRQPQEAVAQPVDLVTADLTADAAELEARVQRYQAHLAQMVRWAAAARKQILIGIEPTLLDRNQAQLSVQEQAVLASLGSSYQRQMQAGSSKLTAAAQKATQSSANAKLLDFKDLYAQSAKPVFQSATSLTDEAYAQLAERFYQAIAAQLAIEPKPFGQ